MRFLFSYFFLGLALAVVACAQIVLDPSPARVMGHPSVTPAEQLLITNINPNLGVNGGLYVPSGVAVDTTGATPILYVADAGNNRVLAWKNASSATLANLQAPDLIIGQPNSATTLPAVNGGFYSPTGLLVDPKGNLWVADSGNNRVLRYPVPFANTANETPDIVLGQPDKFSSRSANQGGAVSNKTICFNSSCPAGNGPFVSALAMDTNGNLFVADAGNNRVLRFPAAALVSGAVDPAADIVIGQPSFTLTSGPSSQTDNVHLGAPGGLAFDAEGHLFVTDAAGRLVVYAGAVSSPTAANGIGPIRFAGVVAQNSSTPAACVPATGVTATACNMSNPAGVAIINDGPAVLDSGFNRLLIFDKFGSADWATTDPMLASPPPIAIAAVGQGITLTNFSGNMRNAGNPQPSAGTLWSPQAATAAGTDVFVADAGNNRVLVFPGSAQSAAATVVLGQLNFPYNSPNAIQGKEFDFGNGASGDAGLAVDSSGSTPRLYVSDPNNNRVLAFADARKVAPGVKADLVIGQPDLVTGVCNYGGAVALPKLTPQPTQSSLCYPTGLAVDPSTGDLYVADTLNGRVLRFPAPFDPANSSQQANLVFGQSGFTGVPNPTAGQSVMVAPYGVLFDSNFGLFVSDVTANRVLLFPLKNAADGEAATQVFGQTSFTLTSSSVLSAPHHIAEDTVNNLYVADSAHNQVLVFPIIQGDTSITTPVYTYNTNSGGGGLSGPQAVWVNKNTVRGYQNDVWVGDNTGLNRFPSPSITGTSSPATLTMPAVEAQCGQSLICSGNNVAVFPSIALAQDSYGNLYSADSTNRVGVHYPALAGQNGANDTCIMGCDLGGLNDQPVYIAPGAFASIYSFGPPFTATPVSETIGTNLAGLQVLVNSTAAYMTTVATGQINFIVPFEAPTSGTAQIVVVNSSTSQVMGSGNLLMNPASPGFFTLNSQGTGNIAALNCNTTPCDNTINGTQNPAKPGSVIQMFLTGQGTGLSSKPPDGRGVAGITTSAKPVVIIGTTQATVLYSGLTACCAGLWQINAMVPTNPGQPAGAGFANGVFPVLVDFLGYRSNSQANQLNPSIATTMVISAPQ